MEIKGHELNNKDRAMAGEMQIRPMTEADIETIAAIEQACFTDPWNERMLLSTLSAPAEEAYVAEICGHAAGDDRIIVGYMSLMHAADEGELLRIAVKPSCRRRGIADRMMETMATWAEAQGIVSIFLEVRSENAGAIALYEKHGFRNLGLRKNYYHDPEDHACIMKRE